MGWEGVRVGGMWMKWRWEHTPGFWLASTAQYMKEHVACNRRFHTTPLYHHAENGAIIRFDCRLARTECRNNKLASFCIVWKNGWLTFPSCSIQGLCVSTSRLFQKSWIFKIFVQLPAKYSIKILVTCEVATSYVVLGKLASEWGSCSNTDTRHTLSHVTTSLLCSPWQWNLKLAVTLFYKPKQEKRSSFEQKNNQQSLTGKRGSLQQCWTIKNANAV